MGLRDAESILRKYKIESGDKEAILDEIRKSSDTSNPMTGAGALKPNWKRGLAIGLAAAGGNTEPLRQLGEARKTQATRRFELGGMILSGIKNGVIDQNEGARALENLGPEFSSFLTQDTSPPSNLEDLGGGPPEDTLSTIINPKEEEKSLGLTRFGAYIPSQDKRVTAFSSKEGNIFLREKGKLVRAPDDIIPVGSSVTGSAEDVLGKKTKNEIENRLLNAKDRKARISRIKDLYKEKYLTYSTQLGEVVKKFGEKAGILKMTKEQKAQTAEYAKFRQATVADLNQYIHDLSGAAVTVQEAKRLSKAVQSMSDSPTQFAAKIEGILEQLEASDIRYQYWLDNGLIDTKMEKTDYARAIQRNSGDAPLEAFQAISRAKEALKRNPGKREIILDRTKQWLKQNGYNENLIELTNGD